MTNHAIENADSYLETFRELFELIDDLENEPSSLAELASEDSEFDVDAITKLLDRHDVPYDIDTPLQDLAENIRETLRERPLSVLVRSEWHEPGVADSEPGEYEILLTTGGPALRITGELDKYGEPATSFLEYQDWGTPWTMRTCGGVLTRFACLFYYG